MTDKADRNVRLFLSYITGAACDNKERECNGGNDS